jgi:hypothetical protein
MLLSEVPVTPEEFGRATGWDIKPEGACKGDVCVPLPGDHFDVMATAERLGMAVVHDPELGLSAIGPATLGGHALTSGAAPDLVLPDLDGRDFHLSSLRGQKVAIVSWAPY